MKRRKNKIHYNEINAPRRYLLNLLSGFAILTLVSSCISPPPTSIAKSVLPAANIYYVDGSRGIDTNRGSQSQPWKTIQKCLDWVRPGETCQILGGTYNETLTLRTSGTQTSPIEFIANGVVTVNSGKSQTLITSGAISDYIIDGFRFISTSVSTQNDPMSASVNFAHNYWGDGDAFEKGNDRFVLRNCYIEGSVYFYGSDNLVENCELNGKGVVSNGLTERSQPSENNIFRNNIIHDYTARGGWTLHYVVNSLWKNNTIYNIGNNGGIDCDGAGHAVYKCNIVENTFYNIKNGGGVLLENSFDSTIENNVIYNSGSGIGVINYDISNGSDPFKSDKNYKGLMTNTIIRNNVIYNITNDAILCHAVRGNQILNNTIYNVKTTLGYFGAIGLAGYNQIGCPDWTIKNNIFSQTPIDFFIFGTPSKTIDYNFYDVFSVNIDKVGSKTFPQWQELGYDLNSKIGNPLFVNEATGDFRLQPNSPGCTSGENGTYMGAFPCH